MALPGQPSPRLRQFLVGLTKIVEITFAKPPPVVPSEQEMFGQIPNLNLHIVSEASAGVGRPLPVLPCEDRWLNVREEPIDFSIALLQSSPGFRHGNLESSSGCGSPYLVRPSSLCPYSEVASAPRLLPDQGQRHAVDRSARDNRWRTHHDLDGLWQAPNCHQRSTKIEDSILLRQHAYSSSLPDIPPMLDEQLDGTTLRIERR